MLFSFTIILDRDIPQCVDYITLFVCGSCVMSCLITTCNISLFKVPFALIRGISKEIRKPGSLEKFSTLPPPLRRQVHSHSASESSCSLPRPQSFPISYPRNTMSGILMSENGILSEATNLTSRPWLWIFFIFVLLTASFSKPSRSLGL